VPRRGFFAEIQYQNQLAEKRRMQAERAAAREYLAALRQQEQAQARAERAQAAFARATVAEQKAAEREAKRLHQEARLAEVASMNARLRETYSEIDSLLAATLDVDDFVELERLRTTAEHPPFAQSDLEVPAPPPTLVSAPPEPVFSEPEAPKGLGGLFGRKKHAAAVTAAQEAFAQLHATWDLKAAAIPGRQLQQMKDHDVAEQQRLEALERARAQYNRECEAREAEATEANEALDALMSGLAAGVDAAIQDYVGIVLSNSVYPEAFPVEYDFEFDAALKELVLTAVVPPPNTLPSTRQYKYVKADDEITATDASKRELKDRYNGAVHQVALRTLHEVFEADRACHIESIALTVSTDAIDPATGRDKRTDLVAVGADRTSFITFDLHNIVPEATLKHLGASLSKNPHDLVGIDSRRGVRGAER
jgi:restriction system protein